MPSSSEQPHDRSRLLPRLILLGFGLRLGLMLVSRGTNDIAIWFGLAGALSDQGLERTYLVEPFFNHPPLMGLLSVLVLRISEATHLPFSLVFKVPVLAAEAGSAWLLYRIWAERSGREAGLRAAAAYALALAPIVISGYHGNTDAIYFCLVLAAAYLMESRRAPFWAGLAMAGALNVKLIPVVAVLPLWSRCTRRRDAGRYALGGLMGALPFLWVLAMFAPDARRAFLERLLLYRSNPEYWGVELFVRWGQAALDPVLPALGALVRGVGDVYAAVGGEVVLLASALLAVRHVVAARQEGHAVLDSYELVFLGLALFLLLAPGFGIQYVGCVVAPLMAINVRRGFVVATVTGAFITTVYAYSVVDWTPIYSFHLPLPAWFSPLSLAAWASVLWAAWASRGRLAPLWRRQGSPQTEAHSASTLR